MSTFESSDREKLTGLLEEQLGLYEQMVLLCEQQTQSLSQEDVEKLNESFAQVEELRNKINGLQQETEPLLQSYVSAKNPEDESTIDADIDELAGVIQEKIQKCVSINGQNLKTIKRMSEEHRKKIDEQRSKREGITGYAQSVTTSSEMFDKTH